VSSVSAAQVFRIGAAAMVAQQRRLEVTSNNLANVNTVAFSGSRVEFKEVLAEEAMTDSTGVAIGAIRHVWRQGTVRPTGRKLDLAIQGEGFFVVGLPDGRTGYTRAGSFECQADGSLTTGHGYRLVPNVVIPEDAEDYHVNPDGTVVVRASGSNDWTEAGRVQLAVFPNPEGLEHAGAGVYVSSEASGEPLVVAPGQSGAGRVIAEALEDSSVDLGEQMVELLVAQRMYSVGLKVVQTADEMQQLINQVLRG